MRNVITRVLLLGCLTGIAVLGAACCKCTPPPATPSAQAPAPERVNTAVSAGEGTTAPTTQQACAACNGKWGKHGLSDLDSCLCRTKDSGRECRDGADCQGQCVAEDKDFVVMDQGPPARGHFKGRCSEFVVTFGCFRFVPKGAGSRGPLPIDEAAEHLCYD